MWVAGRELCILTITEHMERAKINFKINANVQPAAGNGNQAIKHGVGKDSSQLTNDGSQFGHSGARSACKTR